MPEPATSSGDSAAPFGGEFTVTQDETTLTIASTNPRQKLTRIYYLERADPTNSAASSQSDSLMAKAVWRNGTLHVPAPSATEGAAATLELSLDPVGQLVVRRAPAPGSAALFRRRQCYKRKSGPAAILER